MITLLLVCFLLYGGISLTLLIVAIGHAEEGYEDDSGFHRESLQWKADSASPEGGITLWDQVEGASCQLDLRPPFRPIGNNAFTPHPQ